MSTLMVACLRRCSEACGRDDTTNPQRDFLDIHHIHQAEELDFSHRFLTSIHYKRLQFLVHFYLLYKTTEEDHQQIQFAAKKDLEGRLVVLAQNSVATVCHPIYKQFLLTKLIYQYQVHLLLK